MTSPALILPIILADPSLPQVDYADLTNVPEFESDASEHWLFDAGDADNLVGRLNGLALTPVGSAPTHSANYLRTADGTTGNRHGLATPFDDSATMTMCAVVQREALGAFSGRVALGSYTTTTGQGFLWTPEGFARTRAHAGSALGTSGVANGAWVFIALACDDVTDLSRGYVAGVAQTEVSVSKSVAANKLALGNGYYTPSGYEQGTAAAELIVYNGRGLSFAELGEVYARSKVRMARRGITVA